MSKIVKFLYIANYWSPRLPQLCLLHIRPSYQVPMNSSRTSAHEIFWMADNKKPRMRNIQGFEDVL